MATADIKRHQALELRTGGAATCQYDVGDVAVIAVAELLRVL